MREGEVEAEAEGEVLVWVHEWGGDAGRGIWSGCPSGGANLLGDPSEDVGGPGYRDNGGK